MSTAGPRADRARRPWWRRRLWLLVPLSAVLLGPGVWTWWAELHPEQERELRVLVHDRLQEWFPEEMALPQDQYGFIPRASEGVGEGGPDVILLHGLDELGTIWDDLVPALDEAGIAAWEFRYPNDQAIDRSTDLLAKVWPELDPDHPVILLGHSMGGLVSRDFVTRWRHPVEGEPQVAGPPVRAVLMVATPNQGSEWARLRMWLEVRELLVTATQQRLSLFTGLREGTGAAKIDLRPDSAFLADLNARPWPEEIPVRLIGGVLTEPTPEMKRSIDALSAEFGRDELAEALEAWWSQLGEGLGDGAVPVASVALPWAPPPLVLNATHRGLVARNPLIDAEPPAIPHIVEILEGWRDP